MSGIGWAYVAGGAAYFASLVLVALEWRHEREVARWATRSNPFRTYEQRVGDPPVGPDAYYLQRFVDRYPSQAERNRHVLWHFRSVERPMHRLGRPK